MSKKTFQLVTGVVTGLATIASAVLTFVQPPYAPAWVGVTGIVSGAIIEACTLFVKPEEVTKK